MKKKSLFNKNLINPLLIYFFQVIIVFLIFFELIRFVLLITNISQFQSIPILTLLKSFWVGLRFDTSVTLYALAPLFMINYLFYFFKKERWLKYINTFYLTIVFFIYSFLGVAEIEFYKYFKTRLNAFFVNWGEDADFVLKMVWQSYSIPIYLLILVTLLSTSYIIFKILQKKFFQKKTSLGFASKVIAFIIVLPLIFLGIRGTFSYKSPLRWGHAYFSSYNPANQLALNGIFTLANDILYQKKDFATLEKSLGIQNLDVAAQIVENLIQDSTGKFIPFPLREYQFKAKPNEWNVVIILLESFSDYGIHKFESDRIPLYFNRIKNEGIYFRNFYSNGFHTSMGIFTSLFGMPGVYGKTILKRNEGQQVFSGILNILKARGYKTYFGVPHDPNFENMAGFLRGNGVERIISQFDFSSKEALSKLGVADHKLFEKMNECFKESRQPFIGVILSANNHGPWIIPKVSGKTFKSTFDYTDWVLQHFLELAEMEEYYKNTIFIITGDHGKAETPGYEFNLQSTHIPCLIYNPILIKPKVVQNICGHIDLTQTILGILGTDFSTTNFGRDILHIPNKPLGFVLMQEGNMLGFIYNDWYLIDRIGGKSHLYQYRSNFPFKNFADEHPEILQDLKSKARSIYIIGNDFILNRKVAPSFWISQKK